MQGSNQNTNEHSDYVEHGLKGSAGWSSIYELPCSLFDFFLVGMLNNTQESVYAFCTHDKQIFLLDISQSFMHLHL